MIVIGLTGGIGMGKTTASSMLRAMGVPVHDADAQVHALLAAGGAAVAPVGRLFPSALSKTQDGEPFIDRAALGRLVFGDPSALVQLESVLHPLVRAASDAFRARWKKEGADVIALDIPLLFETGGEGRVDVILCISASPDVQRSRVLARPGMTPEKFERILARQTPDGEKARRSDYVVRSDQGMEAMQEQLASIIATLRGQGRS